MLLCALILALGVAAVPFKEPLNSMDRLGVIENNRLLGSYYEGPNGIYLIPNHGGNANAPIPTPTFLSIEARQQPQPFQPAGPLSLQQTTSYQSPIFPSGTWPPYQIRPDITNTRPKITYATVRQPCASAITVVYPGPTVTSTALVYVTENAPDFQAPPGAATTKAPGPPPFSLNSSLLPSVTTTVTVTA